MLEELVEGIAYYSIVVVTSTALYTYFLFRASKVLEEGFPSVFIRLALGLFVYTAIHSSLGLLSRYSEFLYSCMPDVVLYTLAILVLALVAGIILGSRAVCGALSVLGSSITRKLLGVLSEGEVEGHRFWLCSRCPIGVFTSFTGSEVYVHTRLAEVLSREELKSALLREAFRREDRFLSIVDAASTLSWCLAVILFALLSACLPGLHAGAYLNAAAATVAASTVGWIREHPADLRCAELSNPEHLLSAVAKAYRVALEESRSAVEKHVENVEAVYSNTVHCFKVNIERALGEYFANLVIPSLVLHVRRDPPPVVRAVAMCGKHKYL
ncbi:MAG: hypothetical protein QXG29_05885 [Sulfolobales archaeon]